MGLSGSAFLAVIPGPGLLFGLMLTAAIGGGYAARLVHIPRVVGFLLGGVSLQWGLSELLGARQDESVGTSLEAAAAPLSVIKDLALGLILFSIGSVFERSKLRSVGRKALKISAVEIGFVAVGVLVVSLFGAVVSLSDEPLGGRVILAALLGAAAIATAPAATLFVLREYDAKGPVTDTLLTLTAVNNAVCIVLFQVLFLILAGTGALQTTGLLVGQPVLSLLVSILGSVVLGAVFAAILSMVHARLPLTETLLFFFALFILLGAGEQWLWTHQGLSYNFLLTSLVLGGVFANIAIDARKLETTLHTIGLPIFAGFFVMAGFNLHVEDLITMGWLGSGYVVARFGGKYLGCRIGARWAGASRRDGERLGPALICQAAVVIGLASFVDRYWDSPLAAQFSTIVLGSVVVFELVGPLLVKRCVVQAGEVKAVTLLSRGGTESGGSIARLTFQSLGRLVGWPRRKGSADTETLLVKHIMRTNIQFVRASATFNEVLHHIERSTHAHFTVVTDTNDFVGVIHFSDVRDVIYDPALTELLTAVDLADTDSPTVAMDLPLRKLLDVFTRLNVGVLPVVERSDGRRVVGLVEQRDLLRALHLPAGAA